MKRYLAAIVMLAVFLALFIPLASSSPDGLERVASSIDALQPEPVWRGVMNDYGVSVVGNGYVSTLAAGLLGTLFVLGSTLILGTVITRNGQKAKKKS